LFSDEIQAGLRPYELRQLTSHEVGERPSDIAKRLREAGHRHKELDLSERRRRSTTHSPAQ